MSIIDKIKEKLKKYPQLKYKVQGNTITVFPPSSFGFSVWCEERNGEFTIGFDGFHEEFKNEEDALNFFGFGLSDNCRLKVIIRGETKCSWTLESKEENGWISNSTTGLIFIPFWKKKRVKYLSNSIIKSKL